MSILAIANLRLSSTDKQNIAYSLGPPLLGFAIIPTLARALNLESMPPWPQLPLSHAWLLKHCTRVEGSPIGAPRPWTLLTSALTHTSAEHRDASAITLLFNGWRPARVLGVYGFALVFYGGHLAALLNNSGQLMQLTRRLDKLTYNTLPAWATPKAAKLYRGLAPANCLGASAGNFALIGVDFCMLLEDAIDVYRRWQWEQRLDDIDDGIPLLSPALQSLLALGLSVASIAQLVLSERRSLQSGSPSGVSHAAHLTGFAWGVGVGLVRYAWRRWARRSWEGASGSAARRAGFGRRLGGSGGGRRLGGR